jgi:hypothetical protein
MAAKRMFHKVHKVELIQKALDYVEIANQEECDHLRRASANAPYVLSTLLDDITIGQKSTDKFPFKEIYNPNYIEKSVSPLKPIFISRSSTSVTLKMPGYNPLVSEYELEQDPNVGILKDMAVYGKDSDQHDTTIMEEEVDIDDLLGKDNSTIQKRDCCLLDCDLDKTGIRIPIDSTLTIKGLKMNQTYRFAVAAYSLKEGV